MYMDSFFWGGGFEIMFTLVFVLIIGIFVVTAVKGLSQWNKNNHCPRLSVTASVVSKRTNVSRHSHPNAGDATGAHGFHSTTSTSYYATFQVESCLLYTSVRDFPWKIGTKDTDHRYAFLL